nr:hypothetical protein [Tanacetum cinerariifolium]
MVGLQFNKYKGDKVLDEEQLEFLAELGVTEGQDTQTTMPHNATFQTNDLDAFDSDCNEAPGTKAVLMANLSSCDSDVISEVRISKATQDNSILHNIVQEMHYSEQPAFDPASNIKITSDSNIISYEQYLKEMESADVQNKTTTEQQNVVMIDSIQIVYI